MSSPISSFDPSSYARIHSDHSKQQAQQPTQQPTKTDHVEQNPSMQNPQALDDTVQKHGGHGGGHGGHSKITEVQSSEKSFRSHFRHMKSPTDMINQQRLMHDLELQEQLKKAALLKKKMVEKSNQLDKKLVKKDKKDQREKKKNKQGRYPYYEETS
jgi:hypothetical protein